MLWEHLSQKLVSLDQVRSEDRVVTYKYGLSPVWGMCAQSQQGLTISGDYIKLGFTF